MDKEINMTPQYTHDNNEPCVFLGRYNEYDLYARQGRDEVLARFGNEVWAYESGWNLPMPVCLIVAKLRVLEGRGKAI